MVKIKYLNKLIFFILTIFLIPNLLIADVLSYPETLTITANVVSEGGGGGGSGGGGGGTPTLPTIVNFSGMAYPNSKVTVLKNNVVAVTTIADPSAKFSTAINNLEPGTYSFSVYGEDSNGIKSLTFSFPVFVTQGTTVNIGGIFLSPTINVDKSEVRKGDNLIVFGQTVPNAQVNIVFHSDQEILKQTATGVTGLYRYTMDTTPFDYGGHNVKSKTVIEGDVSAISAEVPFIVGLISKLKDTQACGILRGDLNCDGRVNLVDFSIMAYWYKRISPPANVDLNGDGNITLVDFSIMVFNWTG